MKIYRLIYGDKPYSIYGVAPIGIGVTGFWTPHLECIQNMCNAHNDFCAFANGGGAYIGDDEMSILVADIADAVLATEDFLKSKKSNHVEDFDRDEIFVLQILKFEKFGYLEFLNDEAAFKIYLKSIGVADFTLVESSKHQCLFRINGEYRTVRRVGDEFFLL